MSEKIERTSPLFLAGLKKLCPLCRAKPGKDCRQKSGRNLYPPHEQRLQQVRPEGSNGGLYQGEK